MTFTNLVRRRVPLWAGLLVSLAASGCQYQVSIGMPLASNMGQPTPPSAATTGPAGEPPATQQAAYQYPSRFVDPPAAQPDPPADPRPARPVAAVQGKQMPGDARPPGEQRGEGAAPGAVPAVAPEPSYTGRIPTELEKTFMPCYIIEPPDILLLDAVRIVPKGPYRIEPLDVLQIIVADALPNQPIAGQYQVTPDGVINLGFSYGSVRVAGMTLDFAVNEIKKHLMARALANPQVSIALAAFRGVQQVRGEHLVGMDGTISLGSFGCVNVVGLSLKQAKVAIEKHLSQFLLNPEVSLQVGGYNSKYYYVIFDGGGYGQQVYRVASVGNETVLDAIAAVGGLPAVSSKKRIWVARPTPCDKPGYQILPVDWQVIVQAGSTCTNYQLFPGDRVYVAADPLIGADNALAKFFAPIERILGVTLLGASTVQAIQNVANNNRINSGTFIGF
jgi:polysaccharide export outer membrane protein